MQYHKCILSACLVVFCLLLTLAAYPVSSGSRVQQPQQSGQQTRPRRAAESPEPAEDTIKIDTELVLLDIRVTDKRAAPVFKLSKDDFTVVEDKVKQNVETVNSEEVPLSFGIVVDTSSSMRSRLQAIIEAAQILIKQMRKEDEAFLVQFKTDVKLVQDFTSDPKRLDDALGEFYASGGTSLLDAIIETSAHAQTRGHNRRKAVIIISDGLEKNSKTREQAVLDAVRKNEVQLYLVGFIDEEDPKNQLRNMVSRRGRDILAELAKDSGGRAFFPKSTGEMTGIAEEISRDLRTQYVLSYYPANERRDGRFRQVNVVVRDRNGKELMVATRPGYFARRR